MFIYIFIFILIYPYFKYICSCICFECRRFIKEYMRIIRSCPKFEYQTQNLFFKGAPSQTYKSLSFPPSSDNPLQFKKSISQQETFWIPSDHTHNLLFLFPLF